MDAILQMQVYKLQAIARILYDAGYPELHQDILSVAHRLELDLDNNPSFSRKAVFPENFE